MAEKKEYRKLTRIEIEPAENGGHTVRHHYKTEMRRDSRSHSGIMMGAEEPEHHVFGPHEGHEMLAHVANHLEIPEGEMDEEGGEGDSSEEEGA
jgi:hypothetical protein